MNSSEQIVREDAITLGSGNGVSFIVCLLAAVLIFSLKLHTKLVYRLSLYQVLSSLALSTMVLLQLLFVNYDQLRKSQKDTYDILCKAVGWLTLYVEWTKLMFTMWVTFHIFCFAVFYKNLRRLEVMYAVTSLIFPAIMAAVPLTTDSYGINADRTYCFVYNNNSAAFVERFAIWDGPATFILLIASIAMVVMVIKLAYFPCKRKLSGHVPIPGDRDVFSKALQQMLPLSAFPILFLLFEIPLFVFHIYAAQYSLVSDDLVIARTVFVSCWSLSSGTTVIIHIIVAKCLARRKKPFSRFLVV